MLNFVSHTVHCLFGNTKLELQHWQRGLVNTRNCSHCSDILTLPDFTQMTLTLLDLYCSRKIPYLREIEVLFFSVALELGLQDLQSTS